MKLPQPQLRALIGDVLRSDADLDAFCSDHFPDIARRFTDGMQRTRKVNILLEQADHEQLTALLRPPAGGALGAAEHPSAPTAATGRIRVLYMAANPRTTAQLELGREVRGIEDRIRATEHRDAIEVVSRWAVRPDDLQHALLDQRPHVVHFSGHGTARDEILLEDDGGGATPVDYDALADLISILRDNLRLVVLNACYSEPLAAALTRVVDCAIGMDQPITDAAAIEFAAAFYRGIGFGRSVGDAFRLGRNALRLRNLPEAHTPRIKVKAGLSADALFLVSPR